MSAKDRHFTQLAAQIIGGKDAVKALDRGDCPVCRRPIGEFRDRLSRKEFGISGLCQECQDEVFGCQDEVFG